ncbi:MAG TPA: class I adenylate-forming enzyme family protein, partial [Candidatus Babeliaceae bacterium]|nr:class I adenylate-forming enzyme family protein [Candidatus Babeliaceae bacterium]
MGNNSAEERRYQMLYAQLCPGNKIPFAGTLLRRAACYWPEKIALVCGTTSLTYQELYARSLQVTAVLNSYVQARDRVIIFYENSIDFYIAYYGAWQCGVVVVPLNIFLNPHELEHIIQDSQPSVILVSEKLKEKISPEYAHRIVDIDNALSNSPESQADQARPIEILGLEDDEMAALLYTSGTTGLPKGVMLSSRNIIVNCIQGVALFQVKDND